MSGSHVPALLTVTPMVGRLDGDGKIVDSFQAGPERIVDVVNVENDPRDLSLKISSKIGGYTTKVGYEPKYAEAFERAFEPR